MSDQYPIRVDQLSLEELIAALEIDLEQKGDRTIPIGFHNPHSWRGDYADLAFEPARDVTVSSMLEAAREALGNTYQGWKGGDFVMTKHTSCWLAYEGTSAAETIGYLSLAGMLS